MPKQDVETYPGQIADRKTDEGYATENLMEVRVICMVYQFYYSTTKNFLTEYGSMSKAEMEGRVASLIHITTTNQVLILKF